MRNGLVHTEAGKVFAPRIEKRGMNQHARVHSGIENGSLTQNEVGVLQEMKAGAVENLTEAKADNGWVGPYERMGVRRDLGRISATIFDLKHNQI